MLKTLLKILFGKRRRDRHKTYSWFSEINCLDLSQTSLGNLAISDLRVLISQQICLEALIPVALGHLESGLIMSGSEALGSLLESVQRLPPEFWTQHPDLWARWQKTEAVLNSKARSIRDLAE